MKRDQNKRVLCLTAAAFLLLAGAAADQAMAYFTTNAEAAGARPIRLASTVTEIDEGDRVPDWTKHIVIRNASQEAGGEACYVRVKVFIGEASYDDGAGGLKERLSFTAPEGGWTKGTEADAYGYYYYYCQQALPPGGASPELLVKIDPSGIEEDFNVIVVQESTPAGLYEAEGFDPEQAVWTAKAEVVEPERGLTDNE